MSTDNLPPLPYGLRLISAASPGLDAEGQIRAYARAAIAADRAARAEQQVRTKAVLIVRHRAAALRETNRKKYSGERARTIAMLVRLARKIETET